MKINLKKTNSVPSDTNVILLATDAEKIENNILTKEEQSHIRENYNQRDIKQFIFNKLSHFVLVRIIPPENDDYKLWESLRKIGDEVQITLNAMKIKSLIIVGNEMKKEDILAFIEGIILGNYQFIKYLNNKSKKINNLEEVNIHSEVIEENDLLLQSVVLDAVIRARDMINEPVSFMNTKKLTQTFEEMAAESGIKIEVLNKKKIESLKMGGLLAVNKGSVDPPTLTVMEWKPEHYVNQKPVILVGKGVVYDTGGLNLKTGPNMENMKMDMAGAAMMAAVIFAIAKARLPLYIIALMPVTDNRLNGNAYASGDIITMYDGTTVEVINTDAEGRLILADALSYAKKFNPELVVNAATLTGSAMRAIGKYGIVAMHSDAGKDMEALKISGNRTYERIAEVPFWEEYGELLKSEIADMKNIGPPEAGMITAGKFLEHFTDYPFIHLDIAGPAFTEKRDSYRNTGGTGIGVRLLFDFLKNKL